MDAFDAGEARGLLGLDGMHAWVPSGCHVSRIQPLFIQLCTNIMTLTVGGFALCAVAVVCEWDD